MDNKYFITTILLLFLPVMVFSLDSRTLALGGSFLAIGEDVAAINYNPAGIYNPEPKHKQFKIIDLTISGDMITFITTMVNISTSMAGISETQEDQGYMDIKGVGMFNGVMGTVEEMDGTNSGFLTENSLGTIQLNMGPPAISITPRIFLGVEPWIDLDALTSGDLKITTGTLNIDFSGIGYVYEYSTDTPSASLLGARDNLTNFVGTLVTAGAETGPWTDEQVANALVNKAKYVDGLSDEQIILLASDAEAFLSLFESMYVIMTSTSPELYLEEGLGFIIKDLNVAEITIGFATPIESFWDTALEGLIVGINLKYFMGQTIYKRLTVGEIRYSQQSDYDLLKDENYQRTDSFGIDLGVLYDKKFEWKTRFALSLRNINTPSFKPPPSAEGHDVKFEIPPTAKLGVAYWPIETLTIAADLDLIRSPTFLYSYYTQILSAGAEFVALDDLPNYNVTLRCGVRKNIASPVDSTLYSIGLGLTLMSVTLDLALAYSPHGAPYDQVPEYVSNYFKTMNLGYVPDNWQFAVGLSFRFK